MADTPIHLFAHGRLCLFGEHSDWAGGFRSVNPEILPGLAILIGTEQGIQADAEKAAELIILDCLTDAHIFHCPMEQGALLAYADSGAYDSYAAGVASVMLERYHVGGLKQSITARDLPIRRGLSSSAAFCTLLVRAFSRLYDLNLSLAEVMELAYLGEQRTPSRCGRLDQACVFGMRPVFMEFDGDALRIRTIHVKTPLHYVFADLKRGKDTRRILSDLSQAYPYPKNDAERALHALLGEDNHAIIECAAQAIASGDLRALGALMTRAQVLFDEKARPLSPEELSAPALHALLRNPRVQALTWGGKGVGSQGDGAAQFLARDEQAQSALLDYLTSLGLQAYTLTIPSEDASASEAPDVFAQTEPAVCVAP